MSVAPHKATPRARKAKIAVFGESASGKTHFALTCPDVVVIDAEGSADWFADRVEFRIVPTKSWKDAREVIGDVRSGKIKCGTLVIDSLTSIYNSLKTAAANGNPGRQLTPRDWGILKQQFASMMDELYHKLPCHVVVTGWLADVYAPEGAQVGDRTVKANELVKLGDKMDADKKAMYAFDFVFKLVVDGEGRRYAEVVKTRTPRFEVGQRIKNFSWATLAPLFATEDVAPLGGDTEAEAAERDAALLVPPPAPTQVVDPTLAHKRLVREIYAIKGVDPKSADKQDHYILLCDVAHFSRLNAVAEHWSDYTLEQIQAYLDAAKSAPPTEEPQEPEAPASSEDLEREFDETFPAREAPERKAISEVQLSAIESVIQAKRIRAAQIKAIVEQISGGHTSKIQQLDYEQAKKVLVAIQAAGAR